MHTRRNAHHFPTIFYAWPDISSLLLFHLCSPSLLPPPLRRHISSLHVPIPLRALITSLLIASIAFLPRPSSACSVAAASVDDSSHRCHRFSFRNRNDVQVLLPPQTSKTHKITRAGREWMWRWAVCVRAGEEGASRNLALLQISRWNNNKKQFIKKAKMRSCRISTRLVLRASLFAHDQTSNPCHCIAVSPHH